MDDPELTTCPDCTADMAPDQPCPACRLIYRGEDPR